ncbi:hypothetical protein [Pedobacter sp. BMA]|uniref:hypothetical protein n=1 Tax=Pedobacter sp. BMA TaxID=1663685 RepID=UPI00064B7CDE|nr:hypothetical protein [Pedobacter sp. BMA]KLT65386.1 hypothetical protein AB669_09850 [Pedobacter sp. BMA]
MSKIIFEGWDVGMCKIPFIHLLQNKAGLSLGEAKKLKDRLVNDNEIIELGIESNELAQDIFEAALTLNVRARLNSED